MTGNDGNSNDNSKQEWHQQYSSEGAAKVVAARVAEI